MPTKLTGKKLFMRLPMDTAKGLDHIANSLGVKSTQLINVIIYASPDFKCNAFAEAVENYKRDAKKEPDKQIQEIVLRMGPYAEQIAIAGSKKNNTFAGSWVKALLVEKVKEWEGGGNIFNGNRLSKGQLLPHRSAS